MVGLRTIAVSLALTLALQASLQAQEKPKTLKLMLVGNWPIQRLSVYADLGLLNNMLAENCNGRLQWKTTYVGYPGAASAAVHGLPPQLRKQQPDYVAISYGQLDLFFAGTSKGDPADFRKNMLDLIDLVHENSSTSKIILMTALPFQTNAHYWEKALNKPNGWDDYLDSEYNGITRALAAEQDLPLVDLHAAFSSFDKDTLLGQNERYPNAKGRRLLANVVCKSVARVAMADVLNEKLPPAEKLTAIPEIPGANVKQLVLLGDSVTLLALGKCSLDGSLEAGLNQACGNKILWDIVNCGVGGETVPGALERVEKILDLQQPDYITVSYGLNDMIFTGARQNPAVFEDNLRSLIKIIMKHPTRPQIFLLTCTPFNDVILKTKDFWTKQYPDLFTKGGPNTVLTAQINPITRRLAAEYNLPLFDIHRAMMADDYQHFHSKDGVHPNARGSEFMIEKLQAWMTAYVKAHALKNPQGTQAEEQARSLVEDAKALMKQDAEQASQKLEAAAEKCPYLAEAYVLMDELR